MNIGNVVVRFVNDQPAGIRMVAEHRGAARRREKLLRQLRARSSIIDQRRENSSLRTALNARAVRKVKQPLCYQRLHQCVLLRIRQVRAMTHTSGIVAQRIQGFLAQLAVRDAFRLLQQKIIAERTIGDFLGQRNRRRIASAGLRLVISGCSRSRA